MLALYSLTLFLSATLLFTVEPMVGKMLLPRCGGTPSVWNACMVFFQTVLLLGYGYAHVSTVYLGVRRQAAMHLIVILLPLLVLPIYFNTQSGPPTQGDPTLWLLGQLTLFVGLPFFILSTTAPLLQKWFANLGHAASRDPYFLYSTSNAGSLLALLAYPFLIEPNIGLLSQTSLWHAGYILLVVMIISCAIALWRASRATAQIPVTAASIDPIPAERQEVEPNAEKSSEVTLRQRLKWVLLALVPSSLMLGVTMHIATDIASVPLLWVLPLALYLLTFIIVFARKPILSHSLMIKAMAFAVLLMPLMSMGIPMKFWLAIPVHLLTFFIIAMVCHGEMARTRPGPSQLTEFYFLMSLGGVLGGLFNSLLAPQLFGSVQIFDSVVEYPLMLVAACFLLPGQKGANQRRAFNHIDFAWLTGLIVVMGACVGFALMLDSLKWTSPMMAGMKRNLIIAVLYGLPAIMCLGFKERPIRFALGVAFLFLTMDYYSRANMGNVLLAERNFFGVNRVLLDKKHKYHTLVNGNTLHGLQEMFPKPSREPTGYYCRSGPLGDVFEALSGPMLKRRVAVIGLGTGGMAAYAQPEQRFSFYEIDPAVVEIARNPELFTYLTDCRGTYDIVLGDARIQLAQAADAEFDMIVLDAFSSDSIPMHLLTQEAMELYWHKLKADGVLVLHISNRYLRLEPTLGRLAAANGLVCLSRADLDVNQEEQQKGKRPSQYMVMAREAGNLGRLTENTHWSLSKSTGNAKIWTDDYSDILHVLRW